MPDSFQPDSFVPDEPRSRPVPPGNDRTRQDTSVIGIDHKAIADQIANWASTLPRGMQKPVAMAATFPADVLASLVEMLSSPESIATGGAKPALGAMDATAAKVAGVREATAPFAETLISKKLGLDPDAIDLQATRLRLQAARSRTRQATRAGAVEAPSTPASSAPVSAVPETPATAPSTPAPPQGPAAAPPSLKAAASAAKLKLTPKEFEAFQGLVQQGYDPEKVLKSIQGQRAASALQQRLGTPTNAEVDSAVANRNATGRWPQDRP